MEMGTLLTQVKTVSSTIIETTSQTPVRVLHVDDDAGLLEIAKEILMMEGNLQVDVALSVDEAFRKMRECPFDVVVSDYEMPQKNGLQFLKELREKKKDIPFIIFTGKGREEVAMKALNLGADGYYNKQGSPETVYGELAHAIFSVVKKKKTEEALARSELRWATTLASIGDAVIATDTSGKVTFMNAEAEELTGWNPLEALQKPVKQVFNIINEQTRLDVDDLVGLVLKKRIIVRLVARTLLVRRDGSEVAIDDSAAPIRDKEGKTTGVVLVFRDITQSRKAEDELCRSEEKYQCLFDSTLDGIIVSDAKGVVISANPAAALMLGYENAAELVNLPASTLYANPADMQVLFEHLTKKGAIQDYETKLKRKNGAIFNARTTVTIQKDSQGNFSRSESIFRDITKHKKTEQTLTESERKYRSIFENMLNGFAYCKMLFDEKGKPVDFVYLEINEAFEKLTGLKRQDVVGKNVTEAIPGIKETNPELFDIYGRVSLTGKEERFEIFVEPLKIWLSILAYSSEKGYFSAVFEDITERKKLEKENENKVAEIAKIVNNIGDLLFVMDADRRLVMVNKSTCDAFKKKPEELIGKHCYEIVHGTDKPWPNCPATKTFETKQTVTDEVDDPHVGMPLLITTSPILDEKGEVTQIVHVAKDITKIKLADMEIHIAANLFDAASDSILVHDLEGRIVYFNEAAHKLRGYSREEFQKLKISDLEAPGNTWDFRSRMKALIDKDTGIFETYNLSKDKTIVPFEIHARVIESDGRKLVLSVARDITERKKMETELKQERDKLEALTMNIGAGLVMISKDYKILWMNDYLKQLTGASENNHCYSSFNTCTTICPDCGVKKVFEGASFDRREYCNQTEFNKDHPVWFELIATPIKDKEGNVVAALELTVNITEKKEAEAKLKESEEKYATTFESSRDALMLLDEKGFFDCNTATLALFGCKSVEEFAKNHPADLSPPTQPDGTPSMEAAINHINRAFKTGTDSFFWVHKRTDGTTFPADVLLTRMPLKARNVLQATVRDVSERKKAEEKLKEDSDRIEMMNEKLRVVGGLTRHDVRNKLSAVTGYAYLLKKKHPDRADIVDGLAKMEQAVKEAMKIFEFAKMYEQLGVEELTYVDVEKTVNEAVTLFSGFNLKVANECHGLSLLADSFLRQLFYNFMDNTRKYGKTTTTIRVHYEKAESDGLRLIYEDDGVGISAENKVKLFSEGFSTGGSTGFGLFLIRKMMDVYGWEIQETGEPGEGAKFVITVPKVNRNEKENFQIAT